MHIVLTATAIPDHLHGYLSRFLSEVDAGVYVGNTSPPVMERLWERCLHARITGSMTLIFTTPDTEQGYAIRTNGPHRRAVVDLDGAWLIATRHPLPEADERA